MYGMYFLLLIFVLQCIARINLVEGLLLPFLYIYTCVIFNKCIQTLKKQYTIIVVELVEDV